MALTDEQLQDRRRMLGSSDIASLFTDADGKSLNPFGTAYDVWVDKVYQRKRDVDTAAQSIGHRYELALVEYAEKELGCKIQTDPKLLDFLAHDILDVNGNPFNRSHPDGYTYGTHIFGSDKYTDTSGIEAKTSGQANEWGESGSDAVPFRVILQAQHQMLCTGWKRVFVPVLIGRWRLQEEMYLIERDERIIKAIIERATQFWNDYVLTKTPPPETLPGDIQIYKKIEREPQKYGTIDMDVFAAWEEAKAAQKIAETTTEEAFFRVQEQLGDAEAAVLDDGRTFSYFEENGTRKVDFDTLKAKYPDAFIECVSTTTRRMPRIRKAK